MGNVDLLLIASTKIYMTEFLTALKHAEHKHFLPIKNNMLIIWNTEVMKKEDFLTLLLQMC